MELKSVVQINEDQLSKDVFYHEYYKKQNPLVIKNLLKSITIEGCWTFKWLKQYFGDISVNVVNSANANKSYTAVTSWDKKMTLDEYIDSLKTECPYRIFLFDIFSEAPELKKLLKVPKFFKGWLTLNKRFIFFGGKGTNTRIHQDIDMSNVLFVNMEGKRRVLLFSPDQSYNLYKLPFNTFSLVDFSRPDFKKYPRLKNLKGYEVVLEPGDALFIPSGYWHYMDYLEAGMGAAFRKMGPGLKQILNGAKYLFVYLPFDKLMEWIGGQYWYEFKRKWALKGFKGFFDNDDGISYGVEDMAVN